MVKIILIRHAECAGNLEGRWAGQADSPLTVVGVAQARRLAQRLHHEPLAAAYVSDLARARQTAEIALRHLAVPVVLERALREIDLGKWEGLTQAEIAASYGELYARLRESPHDICPPNGESTVRLCERVYRSLDTMASRHRDETVAVFTHGGPLRAIRYAVDGDRDSWRIAAHNAGLSVVEWGPRVRRILLWNDTSHLNPKMVAEAG